MFDQLSDRIADAVVTGLDIAVEFATLGEYRLAVPTGGEARPTAARRAAVFDGANLFASPARSTPAARDTAPASGRVPAVLGTCGQARAHAKPRPASHRAPARSRAGAPGPPQQLCLWR